MQRGDPRADDAMRELQSLLIRSEREQIERLQAELAEMEDRLSDPERLTGVIAPILGDALSQKVKEQRQELIDALYPIIGQLVVRAVTEAMRELARSIDRQLRQATRLDLLWLRIKGTFTGVSHAEMILRQSIPFSTEEIYLIHRESGILLWYANAQSRRPTKDADMVAPMLTAIRDFAEQVLGRGERTELHELHYGNRLILLEFGKTSYVGVVINGEPPATYRADLRQRIWSFDRQCRERLATFNGELVTFVRPAQELFTPLLTDTQDVEG
jgi:hypothetical protein